MSLKDFPTLGTTHCPKQTRRHESGSSYTLTHLNVFSSRGSVKKTWTQAAGLFQTDHFQWSVCLCCLSISTIPSQTWAQVRLRCKRTTLGTPQTFVMRTNLSVLRIMRRINCCLCVCVCVSCTCMLKRKSVSVWSGLHEYRVVILSCYSVSKDVASSINVCVTGDLC